MEAGSNSTCLVSSIKVEVKRKNVPCGWKFPCFAAQLIKRDLFRSPATMCSVAGRVRPAIWDSSTSGFHRLSATKPVSSETSKAERRSL